MSRGREKDVTLDVVILHKEEVLSKLEVEEKSFAAKKESIHRNLVEIEKHEIVLREKQIIERKEENNDTRKRSEAN